MKDVRRVLASLMLNESGQDLIEYALVAGLLGLGGMAVMSGFSGTVGNVFSTVGNTLANSI
jgi:pilus assembly protein Flp/PilA